MANSKRNFIAGRMNKSVDERLVPNGEYVDAMNVRLGSTEDSEIGSVENSKGNSLLTNIILGNFSGTDYNLSANATCIGAFEDGARETIYWFIHDKNANATATDKADLILSYNTQTESTTYHIVSFKNANDVLNTTLNFNEKYLINNVNKVDDFLFFTDNYNPPRKINVTRNYPSPTTITGVDNFNYNDILVIVKPPTESPAVQNSTTDISETYMQERFICFAYRYKYSDNEYSATSQFTTPSFTPSAFNISTATNLNNGMINSTNAAIVTFNSGGSEVKDIEILFKEADSNIIKVIEKLNKNEQNYVDNTNYTYSFTDSKISTILSEGEILRLYDNVPLLANSQTLMGNRLMYGNYVEGYNISNNLSKNYLLQYFTSQVSTELQTTLFQPTASTASYNIDGPVTSNGQFTLDLGTIQNKLKAGSSLNFSFNVVHSKFSGIPTAPTDTTGSFSISFTYILPQAFNTISALVSSTDFQDRIGTSSNIKPVFGASNTSCDGTTFTDTFNCALPATLGTYTKFGGGITSQGQPIRAIVNPLSTSIILQVPAMGYSTSPSAPSTSNTNYEYYNLSNIIVTFQEVGSPSSLHSNRGYQVGMVYMDEFNRATSALTSSNNTEYIPCSASDTQNKLQVTIPSTQRAPSFAKRYKFVIKPDGEDYETIFSRIYYNDPVNNYTYFLLEGENIAKVEEGDRYIVKRDSIGPMGRCAEATVLEKKSQSADFLKDASGTAIKSPAGVYMKMLANDFSTVVGDDAIVLPGQQSSIQNNNGNRVYLEYNNFQKSIDGSGNHTAYTITAGTRITIDFHLFRNKRASCDYRSYKLKREFISTNDYTDIIEWWNGDNIADIIDSGTKDPSSITNTYETDTAVNLTDITAFKNLGTGTTNYFYQWYRDSVTSEIRFLISGSTACTGVIAGGSANIKALFEIFRSENLVVFETEPTEALPDVWYEGAQSYPISTDGNLFHLDNGATGDQDQTSSLPAIINLDFFNCFTFGNGVESYKIYDSITGKSFGLGNRVTTVAEQDYKRAHRANDITYSGIYNDETNLNRLNEFNLGLLNFKPLEESFGPINKLFARETDILVLQEDKISYVLAGKNLLSDASGVSVLTSVPEVLGKQIARIEEYGISNNPESFVAYGPDKFFTDSKRGALIQLKGSSGSAEQLTVISNVGMRSWFRDLFTDSFSTQKLGAYDPYMNEYVLSSNDVGLPSEDVCLPCGRTKTVDFSGDAIGATQTFCVNLPDATGSVTINYNIPSGSTISISRTYDGSTINIPNLTGVGTTSFGKVNVSPNTASFTITNVAGSGASLITVQCPDGSGLTLRTIVLTNNSDTGKFFHISHNFTSSSVLIQSPETQIEFLDNSTGQAVFASSYLEYVGLQGESIFPPNGSSVVMEAHTRPPLDNYTFLNSDKFRWLRSSTNYTNTSTDLATLLPLTATLTKTLGSPTTTSGSFTMPSNTNTYLYLVWDLRSSRGQTICVQTGARDVFPSNTNLLSVCCSCACTATNTEYNIVNNGVTTIQVETELGGSSTFTNIGGGSEADLCSDVFPVYNPTTALGISITAIECGNCP